MESKINYFKADKKNPYHLSVGAVVLNSEGKVLCHHFESLTLKGKTAKDFYILMRETIEPNETIEDCLERGLREEFGCKAKIRRFLGCSVGEINDGEMIINKSTLYFLCDFISFLPEGRLKNDEESLSVLEWHDPNFLIEKMKEQLIRFKRPDADESDILARIKYQTIS